MDSLLFKIVIINIMLRKTENVCHVVRLLVRLAKVIPLIVVEKEHSSCGFCVVCCVWQSIRIRSSLEPLQQW